MSETPATPITFAGKPLELRYRASTVRDFETATGGRVLLQELPKRGITTLGTLLWVGLKHRDERLNLNRVFDYLDDFLEAEGDINALWDEIAQALVAGGLVGARARGKAQSPTS